MDRRRFLALLGAIPLTVPLLVSCKKDDPTPTAPRPKRTGPEHFPHDGIVRAHGGKLWLDGRRFRFIGVNVYSLASFRPGSGKFYCGRAYSDQGVRHLLDEVKAMGLNAIRVPIYQTFTYDGRDFSRLDLIVREARARGIRLVMVLGSQWWHCSKDGYKFADWYADGYRKANGKFRSYRRYVATVVARYKDEPAVLMWQLMNEAESRTTYGASDPETLRAFAADMASVIKAIDPTHVVSFGTQDPTYPGIEGIDFARLHRVRGIDIVEAHDYGDAKDAFPGPVADALATARRVQKPFFIGEVGIKSPPEGKRGRAPLMIAKLDAAWKHGADGFIVWTYRAGGAYGFGPKDPLVAKLKAFTAAHPVRDP